MKLTGLILAGIMAMVVSLTTTPASAQKLIVDEVIAIVGDNPIFLSELEANTQNIILQRKAQGTLSTLSEREEAFEQLLTKALLASCAVMDSLDKDANPIEHMVEAEVNRMSETAGGVLQLEKQTGKPIYQIKADLTIDLKQMQLAQIMEQNIRSRVKIEYAEVQEFLDNLELDETDIIPAQYSYSQIVRLPPQTDERKYAIRERLLSFRQRILDEEITLGALAQLYSVDRSSAIRRGEALLPINGLAPQITEALEGLKPGEVSEIIETDFGYHLAELIEYIGEGNEKQIRFRHILLKPEFTVEESRNVTNQLDSITTQIRLGNLSFADAALRYSDDKDTKQNGGRVFNKSAYMQTGDISNTSSKFMAEELQQEYRHISRLKIGEISDTFEAMDNYGNTVQKIIRLDRIYPAHKANIIEDYDLIAAIALTDKQNKAVGVWTEKNIGRVYVYIKPQYLDLNTQSKQWQAAALRSENRENIKVHIPSHTELEQNWLEYAKQKAIQDSIRMNQPVVLEPVEGGGKKKRKK